MAENISERDKEMMRYALELARNGAGYASPNPMVGCVITDEGGRIVARGWHRCWGEGHAEVNAVAEAEGRGVDLTRCTAYVTLEPCAHYGKTPPCAKLLADKRLKRVVIGSKDPFAKVNGKGIRMLEETGIEVVTGVLEGECKKLNERFFYAHEHRRPWVILKWAQSADGYMAGAEGRQRRISTPLTEVLMHKERALTDAIMAGSGTLRTDNPRLSVRHWPARRLRPAVIDRGRVPENAQVLNSPDLIRIKENDLAEFLNKLYADYGVTSLMVEGGRGLLDEFLAKGLYNELRIEVSNNEIREGLKAPAVELAGMEMDEIGGARIYRRK